MSVDWMLVKGLLCCGLAVYTLIALTREFWKNPGKDLLLLSHRLLLVSGTTGFFLKKGLGYLSLSLWQVNVVEKTLPWWASLPLDLVALALLVLGLVLESSLTLRRRRDREAEAARGPREIKREAGTKPPASKNPAAAAPYGEAQDA